MRKKLFGRKWGFKGHTEHTLNCYSTAEEVGQRTVTENPVLGQIRQGNDEQQLQRKNAGISK